MKYVAYFFNIFTSILALIAGLFYLIFSRIQLFLAYSRFGLTVKQHACYNFETNKLGTSCAFTGKPVSEDL